MITTVSLDYRLVVHSSYIPHLHSFFCILDLVSPYLFTGFVLVDFPIEQASTFSDGADEFDDDALIASEALSCRTGGFERNAGPGNLGMFGSLKFVVLKSKLNLLIPCGFVAIVVKDMTGNNGWVFPLTLLGIIPLAERLGFATEQLAFFTGPTVGGLLNATFGNATELIISIHALRSGKLRVVQQSLLGSILSNLLLVLGCAFFSGGVTCGKTEQNFSKVTILVCSQICTM